MRKLAIGVLVAMGLATAALSGPTLPDFSFAPLLSKYLGQVSVASYTSLNDGKTDATSFLQSAFSAASAGSTLTVPPGTYLVSSTLTLQSGVTYVGAPGAALVATGTAATTDGMLKCTGCVGTRVVGLELNGNTNAGGTVGGKYGIRLISGSNNSLENVYCHDTWQACVFVDSESGFELERGRYINCGRIPASSDNHCIMVGTTTATNLVSARIRGAYVSGALRKGIAVFATSTGVATDLVLEGNTVIGSGLGNIYIAGFAQHQGVSVTGNTTSGGGSVDIQFSSVNGGTLTGNSSRSSGGVGILIDSSVGVTATANNVDLAAGDGISVSSVNSQSSDILLSANDVRHSNQGNTANKAGIHLNAVQASKVLGNIVTDRSGAPLQTYGILEDGASDSNDYAGNKIAGFVTAATALTGTNVTVDAPITRTFSTLGTPGSSSLAYCSDCLKVNPCTAGGTGATARRENGKWVCSDDTPSYNIPGTRLGPMRIVQDLSVLVAGTKTITLPNVFTGSGTYNCVASDTTAANPIAVSYGSATSVTFTGTGTDSFRFICSGT